ncbi:MAG: ABC transporter substrate-binding protein [Leptolyngbya sp. SIO3F4]|nr:ABC transporter substrate-binding protein [Leptolyngbya sp. SIO3F4]
MKRRTFLNTSTISAISAGTLAGCGSTTSSTAEESTTNIQPRVEWRMAATWTKAVDVVFGSAETLSRRVKAMTNGRFVITPYESGEIVPGLEVFDAVKDGTVECGHTSGAFYIDKNPIFGIGTMPFGLNAQQQNAWLYFGGGLEVLQSVYADYGIINFPVGNSGVQMGGWFKNVIETPEDFKRLTMRLPGLGGKVMERLGMKTISLSPDDIFPAMESGKIDAAEFIGPYDDEKLGLYNLAPYYYYPGWWDPGSLFEIYVNLDAWNQLPITYQEIFKSAAIEANLRMLARYDAENGAALQRLILRGAILLPFSPEILQTTQKAAIEFQQELASEDSAFRQVYEQWNQFRSQVYQWHRINELSFADYAFKI